MNGIAEGTPLQIGQKLKLPTQRYLDNGRDAKNRFIALELYRETHAGKLPPDAAIRPRSKLSWTIRSNGIRSRRTDIAMSWISASGRASSKGRCQSIRQRRVRERISGKPGARIAARLTMAAIISLPASTTPATPSTISPRTPISTAAPTASWKIAGQQPCAPGTAFRSTSCRTMSASLFVPIGSRSHGRSTGKNIFSTFANESGGRHRAGR